MNTFLDAIFIVPRKIGKLPLRLRPPRPRQEQIYFIGACNVPITVLDPALTRPGRMGRHIWFRTPTKDDRLDIFDLYLEKVDHEPDLDTDRRRDELARITNGYSPSMIEQCCSMALTIAHSEGRRGSGGRDIVEAMTTVETGTAQNIEYIQEETRAVAIHEAGHAAAGHVYLEKDVLSTRLSIRKRGGSLGHYQSMEKDERFSHFRSHVMGTPDHDARRDGGRARVLRRELAGRQRRRRERHRDRGGDGRDLGDGPRPGPHRGQHRRLRGRGARAQAPRADRRRRS